MMLRLVEEFITPDAAKATIQKLRKNNPKSKYQIVYRIVEMDYSK